jgi:alpha-tubulin suppressor-like RCC1 family protein
MLFFEFWSILVRNRFELFINLGSNSKKYINYIVYGTLGTGGNYTSQNTPLFLTNVNSFNFERIELGFQHFAFAINKLTNTIYSWGRNDVRFYIY